jgi:UDP-glucose 4-epimerase
MKVLVTGGAGFIGSHIVDALLGEGNEVVVVDNLATGLRQNVNPGASFYRSSILDRKLKHIFRVERPDAVFHEAAQTIVSNSVRDPLFDARVNILGSINILDNCVNFGVGRIVYASSCAIYGSPENLPLKEDHALNPISPYGVSKQTVEKYLYTYHSVYGLEYSALRYSNVFGPRQNPGGEAGVVAIFTRQMLSGQQPRIYGDGNKTRSYIYVGDVVRANLLALRSGRSGIFNIGTTEETSDQRIFDLVSRCCSYSGSPRYVDERPGEIRRMCLDCSKALNELGWFPETRLAEGIAKTVEYYRDIKNTVEIRSPVQAGILPGK